MDQRRWNPMPREQFRQLDRGQQLRDRQGRAWTIQAAPSEEDGLARIVIRSGDLVRRVDERWADDYEVVRR
jgi:hypothetical protein